MKTDMVDFGKEIINGTISATEFKTGREIIRFMGEVI